MKKIFISSTFRDMQAERDILHLTVLPELTRFAAKYGQNVSFLDLRWGIDTGGMTEADSNRKVLDVCFEQIDECKPYMVVLLGERYGYIPPANGALTGVSVTEQEIDYGFFQQRCPDACLFYFREFREDAALGGRAGDYLAESESHRLKLGALKRKIRDTAGNRVRTYTAGWDADRQTVTGLEAFARQVTDDIQALLTGEFEQAAAADPLQRHVNAAWQYIEHKALGFAARGQTLETLCEEINGNRAELFLLIGQSGLGKSSLLSALALAMRDQGTQVLPFIGGSQSEPSSVLDLLAQLDIYLLVACGLEKDRTSVIRQNLFRALGARGEHGAQPQGGAGSVSKNNVSFALLRESFIELAACFSKLDKRLLIVIDALDQMTQSSSLQSFAWLIPSLPDNIRIAVSCTDTYPLPKGMPYSVKDRRVILKPLLDTAERRAVVRCMARAADKEIPEAVVDALVSLPGSESPLYLSLCVQRFLMFNADDYKAIQSIGGDGSAINAYLLQLARHMPPETGALCALIAQEAGQRINEKQTGPTLHYLAASRHGLREGDLEALFKARGEPFSALDHARLRKYLRSFFLPKADGTLDFSHRLIRGGFLHQMENQRTVQRELLHHFRAGAETDAFSQAEYAWHAVRLDEKDDLLAFLGGRPVLLPLVQTLHTLTLEDGGQWLTGCIGHALATRRLAALTDSFLLLLLLYAPDVEELQIETRLLEAAIPAVRADAQDRLGSFPKVRVLNTLQSALARAYYRQGMPQKARAAYEQIQAAPDAREDGDCGIPPEDVLALAGVGLPSATASQQENRWFYEATLLEEQADMYNQLNDLEHALACYRKSHECILRIVNAGHSDFVLLYSLAVGCSQLTRTCGRFRRFNEAQAYNKQGFAYLEEARRCLREHGAADRAAQINASRLEAVLYGDRGDYLLTTGDGESALEAYRAAYDTAEALVKSSNDAQSRQDLAFYAKKSADAYFRLFDTGSAKRLYFKGIQLVAYAPGDLMTPASLRLLRDTISNLARVRMMTIFSDQTEYEPLDRISKLLDQRPEAAIGSGEYRWHHALLCLLLADFLRSLGDAETADALEQKAAELCPPEDVLLDCAEGPLQEIVALVEQSLVDETNDALAGARELNKTWDRLIPGVSARITVRYAQRLSELGDERVSKGGGEIAADLYSLSRRLYTQAYEAHRSRQALTDAHGVIQKQVRLLLQENSKEDCASWVYDAYQALHAPDQADDSCLNCIAEGCFCLTMLQFGLPAGLPPSRLWRYAGQFWARAYGLERDEYCREQRDLCRRETGE